MGEMIQRLRFVAGNACERCCIEANDEGDLAWFADHERLMAAKDAELADAQERMRELQKQLGEMRQAILRGTAFPSTHGCHVSPDAESCEINRSIEPEGERLRDELEAWLEKNHIVGIMLDTKRNFVDITINRLPPRIKHVLTHWGAIAVEDLEEQTRAALSPAGTEDSNA